MSLWKEIMDSILKICVLSILCVVTQHTKVLTVKLNLTIDISKLLIFHDQVHNPLEIESL